MIPALVSNRLRFRALQPQDVAALHPTLSDAQSMRWWSRGPLTDMAETAAYLAGGRGTPDWRGFFFAPHDEDAAIGWVSVGERRPSVVEIGYMLARDRTGQGYAGEAVATVLDQLFRVEGTRRVMADTDPDNQASRRMLARLGFVEEGRLRGEWETHIGVRDSIIHGLLRDEWLARYG